MVLSIDKHSRWFAILVTLATLAALGYLVLRIIIPSTGHMTHGFIGRYTASWLLLNGQFGPEVYDNDWFVQNVQTLSGEPIGEIFKPNLPTLALLTIPFTVLPLQFARDTWIWISLGFLFVGIVSIRALFPLPKGQKQTLLWLVFAALTFLFHPIAANFYVGQVYIFVLCLTALALVGIVQKIDWLTGVALGLAFTFKTYGLPLWVLLIVHRRWKSIGWGVVTILILAIMSLPWIGLDTWIAYPKMLFSLNEDSIMVTAYQSTPTFMERFFRYDPVWNPRSVFNRPVVAHGLSIAISIISVVITIWRGIKAPILLFAASLIPLNALLLPVAEEPHFALFLIPIFILLNELAQNSKEQTSWGEWTLLILGILLLAPPLPYKDPAISTGWVALLAYPRLYGGWILWWLSIKLSSPKDV
jgi:hypothetical protein